ncbi:MAG: hypothetical protein GF349_04265 [Candidatus Magasanikbacteria bacterium]|nr:hypothetical protein [Candidatus Magasanikbacteria bacterium]
MTRITPKADPETKKACYLAELLLQLAKKIKYYDDKLIEQGKFIDHVQKISIVWFVLKQPVSFFSHNVIRRALRIIAPLVYNNGDSDKKSVQQIFCRLLGVDMRYLYTFENDYNLKDRQRLYELTMAMIMGRYAYEAVRDCVKRLEVEILAVKITMENLAKLNNFFDKYQDSIDNPMQRMAIVYEGTFIPGVDVQPEHLDRAARQIDMRVNGRQLSYEEIIRIVAGVTEKEYYEFESWEGNRKLEALRQAKEEIGLATKQRQDNLVTPAVWS